jgi:hypothetical protein
MTEREHPLPSEPAPRRSQPDRWDIAGMANALYAETELTQRLGRPPGRRFNIALGRVRLDAWEDEQYIELQTEHSQLALGGVSPHVIPEGGVVFQTPDHETNPNVPRLWLWADGSFAFFSPSRMTETDVFVAEVRAREQERQQAATETGVLASESRPITTPSEEAPPDAPAPAPDIAQAPSGAAAAEQREQNNRVELMGNVSWQPKFREFQSGNARLQFGIAQHLEDGSTRYHTVKAFGDRARRYNGQIQKGDAVRVVGGRATERYKDKGGNEREREFVLLWGLKPLRDQ